MDAPRTPEELQKLRVVDLRKELSSHSLPTTGKKDELVARLHKHLVSLAQEAAATEDAGPSGEVSEPMEVDDSLAQQAKEEQVAAEATKLEQNEERRLAEEKKAAEEAAEKAAQLEQQRLEEEKRLAEEHRLAEERQLAEKAAEEKAAEEKAAAEKAAAEKAAAEKAAEEKAAAEKAAEEKAAAEKAAAEKAAAEKAAEEQRLAEQEQLAVQKQQVEEQQRIAAAEQLRLSQEQETLQAVAQQRAQQVPDMMLLVQQQQALLDKQKTAHEANLRQGRQLQEQRQQLEAALRQNSRLQSENKGNQQMMEQLQQHRQQLLAQGEAISSQQSAVSEQATDYVEQRERNERLIKQVMEQQQLKESEEQKMLLLERQQRLLADHEQLQTAQQQAMEQQAKNAELLRQQQVALLERQREQEQAALQLQEQHRQQQIEAEQRRAEAMQREAEARKQKEEAAAAAKLQSERLLEQERVKAAAPPSLLTMETKPAAAGLKLTAGDDQADRKLPKALEDVLALKDIRAKQVGVEDMDQAVQGSRSTVSVRSAVTQQRPLGDVNEYDDDEDDEGKSSRGKESKNKKRKKKKKSRAARKAEEKRAADVRAAAASEEGAEIDSGVEVEYVPEKPLVGAGDPLYSQFHKIFESFKIDESVSAGGDESSAEASKPKKEAETETGVPRRGAALFGELENEDEGGNKPDTGKLSKKQMKKLTRMSVADLKTVVVRPDLVEMHDVTAPDPRLLLSLKATRNTVAVPRHWCNKRKYLQGKRGFEKPPFELPDYIKATGIMEMRQALADKESDKSLKQKMREKVRPKMGKIDIDYQKLHDAFFKFQRKPRMTVHGDLYYEGKEFETKLREKKPGNLTDDLRTALGMPIGSGAEKFPPPWLIAMQRYGPPPSYPNLKIPGLNAPIPDGCNFGYHAGGWGKPPVDETGRPLYGDVFGQREDNEAEPVSEDAADKGHWGEMESESEEESESESEGEEVADEETMATGIVTPADAGLITPSGLTSIPAGLETPDAIELRKKIEDSMDAGGGDTPALYQVLPEKKASVGAAMMGSAHTYDVGATKKMTADGVEVSLNPEELDMDSSAMQAKYEQTVRAQQGDVQKEDFSDMVAEHSAKAAKKRKKQQTSDKSSKKHKEFKF